MGNIWKTLTIILSIILILLLIINFTLGKDGLRNIKNVKTLTGAKLVDAYKISKVLDKTNPINVCIGNKCMTLGRIK